MSTPAASPTSGPSKQASAPQKQSELNESGSHILSQSILAVLGAEAQTVDIQFPAAHKADLTFTWSGDTIDQSQFQTIQQHACSAAASNSTVQAVAVLKTKRRAKQKQYEISASFGQHAIDAIKKEQGTTADVDNTTKAVAAASIQPTKAKSEKKADGKQQQPAAQSKKQVATTPDIFSTWQPTGKSLPATEATALLQLITQKCPHVQLSDSDVHTLQTAFERRLTMFQNVAYTRGFNATKDLVHEVDLTKFL